MYCPQRKVQVEKFSLNLILHTRQKNKKNRNFVSKTSTPRESPVSTSFDEEHRRYGLTDDADIQGAQYDFCSHRVCFEPGFE